MSLYPKYLVIYAFRSKPTTNAEDMEAALKAWCSICLKYGCLEMQLLKVDDPELQELMRGASPDYVYTQTWESKERHREWRERFDGFNSDLKRSHYTAEEFNVILSIRELTDFTDSMELIVL